MTAKMATAAMALMANGLCLLWPAGTAPTIAPRPARCVMAIRQNACTAFAPCACAIPDENRTVFVLEADLPLADSTDPRRFCRKGEKPYGPAGPVDPAHPYEACKPRSSHGSQRRHPRSTISTYYRPADYKFNPFEFTELEAADNYTKETWIWGYNGFVMPRPQQDTSLPPPDDRIHKCPPGPERKNFRSATPMGFARATFRANARQHWKHPALLCSGPNAGSA